MSDLIGTNRKCLICDKEGRKEVKIIDIISEGEDFKLILSCGHTPKFVGYTLEEKISMTDEVKSRAVDHRYGQIHRTGK
jgi:hypothetical protein